MARTLFTEMILEGETPSSRLVLAAISAKEEIIPASWTIIISDMIGMGLRTGLFFPREIETKIFSALIAEFKEVLIKESSTNLTVANFQFLIPPNLPLEKGGDECSPFYKGGWRGIISLI
jgi:hypothetical protein